MSEIVHYLELTFEQATFLRDVMENVHGGIKSRAQLSLDIIAELEVQEIYSTGQDDMYGAAIFAARGEKLADVAEHRTAAQIWRLGFTAFVAGMRMKEGK